MVGLNELFFLFHAAWIIGATCMALYLGREALITLICLESVLSNLMISKQISLLGMHTICTDVFTIGSIIGLSLVQECFGKATARRTIIINFCMLVFYLVSSNLHVLYVPNDFDTMHDLFAILFKPMPRIIIASMLVYYVVQLFDTWLFGKIKQQCGDMSLTHRLLLCTSASQLLDTVLFTFGALYGNVASVMHIIIVSFVIKMISIVLCAPAIAKIRAFIPVKNHDAI
ncbi:MAG: queuosine precursor transporter [Candidatus Babeliales bacterium]